MYECLIPVLLSVLYTNTESANFDRYGETTYRYPSSTIANLNNDFPYKSVNYRNDVANFPEATRYPNYSPGYSSSTKYPYSGYSTSSYNNNLYNSGSSSYNGVTGSYNTGSSLYNSGSSNVNYNQGYNYNRRYGESYGGQGVGSGLSGGYSSYEAPFMGNMGTCVNRSPQTGIWVDSLMGMWYGVELIQHLGMDTNLDYPRTCIVIHIAEPREQFPNLQATNSTEDNEVNVTCTRDHDYDNMDIKEALGKWRVVELYLHLSKEGVKLYNSCPLITIWETDEIPRTTFGPSTEYQLHHVQHINAKFRQDNRHLRLLWNEAGQTSEYALFFRNDTAGYWHVYDGQNGTLTHLPNYQQFSGTVQVLKAVNDHLLLNFCQEAGMNGRQAQLYSVLLSREPGQLNRWEIDSVHSLLQTKRLSVASRRMVCGNSADRPIISIVFSLLTCLLAYVLGKF